MAFKAEVGCCVAVTITMFEDEGTAWSASGAGVGTTAFRMEVGCRAMATVPGVSSSSSMSDSTCAPSLSCISANNGFRRRSFS